ncbi:cobalamin-binding protein [Marinomonas sp. M1K-6]|uniref:Cobalamin-binding protein n=1 Tax=Marinomonas profundi TaxID=2726122 RepID=A0A847RCR3_9GAMM|nr:cobalamin-binding protein [Marinomonas profundi]NLQ17980.1 cobalamin-binding protein [Marinomonas profundi]UDV01706.1 cobalamin-binding protein [Marinomonas profundi]
MTMIRRVLCAAVLALWLGGWAFVPASFAGPVCVVDDRGQTLCLDQAATRIAALSPGATELIYAAGAGDNVVAVVSYSDYPAAAKSVTSVGSHTRLDLERLLSLQPDLILAWGTGNPSEQIDTLVRLGLPVYYVEPYEFEDIAHTIENMGKLAGTSIAADAQAKRFRTGIHTLRERYKEASPVRTFYQVWAEPLMSMNASHYISKVVSLCGGVNVFADSPRLIPRLSQEAVLLENPEAIIAGGMGERNADWLNPWRTFPNLLATQQDNLFFVPPSLIQRPTPRLLEGAKTLCEKLDIARARR